MTDLKNPPLAPIGQRVRHGPKVGRHEARCTACKAIKPKEAFVTGCSQCRDCRNADARRRRAEKNGRAELARTVEAEPGERVCIRCKEPQPEEFYTSSAGVVCEPCRSTARAATKAAWRAKNLASERARGRAWKRRQRCATLIKRVDENLALLAEAAEKPSMAMTHGRPLMWARLNLPTDMRELAAFSEEEKTEALKWEAGRETRDDMPVGLRKFFDRCRVEFQAAMEERWADPEYVARIHALWKKMFVTTEELEATRFNTDPELRAAKNLDDQLYEDSRAAMKERDRIRGW